MKNSSSKRTLNVRFLIISLVAMLVVAGGVHAVHILQVSRNAKSLLSQANEAESKKDMKEAVRRLEQYVNFEPKDAAAQLRLAMWLADDEFTKESTGRSRAVGALDRAVLLNPDDRDARLKLARLLLAQSYDPKFPDALTEAKSQVEQFDSMPELAKDGEVASLRAEIADTQKEVDEAIKRYQQAIPLLPTRIENYQRLALLLRSKKDQVSKTQAEALEAQADALMDVKEEKNGVVAANPKSGVAYLSRAAYRADFYKDLAGARTDMARALKLDPNEPKILMGAARLARLDGEIEVARGYLERVIALKPKDFDAYLGLAAIESAENRTKETITVLERATKARPDDPEAKFYLIDALISDKQFEKAAPLIAELREKGFRKPLLDYVDARAAFLRDDWIDAIRRLEAVAPLIDVPKERGLREIARQTYQMLAEAYSRRSEEDLVISSYRRALNVPGALPEVEGRLHNQLARALSNTGRPKEAEEEFRKAMVAGSGDSNVDARMLLIQSAISSLASQAPEPRRIDEIVAQIDELARMAPRSAAPAVFRAQLLAYQNKIADAAAVLDAQIKLTPKDVAAWLARISLAERLNNGADLPNLLKQARRSLGDAVELRILELRLASQATGEARKAKIAEAMHGAEGLPPMDRGRLYLMLGLLQVQLGQIDDGIKSFEQWKAAEPKSIKPLLMLFDAYAQKKDQAAVKRTADEIRAMDGGTGPYSKFVQAGPLIEQANRPGIAPAEKTKLLEEARGLLTDAVQTRSNWSRCVLLLGQVHDWLGQNEPAIANYSKALQLGERQPALIRRLVQMLFASRKFDEANAVLKLAQQSNSLTEDLARFASNLSVQLEDYGRALTLATDAARSPGATQGDLLWLNQVLLINAQKALSEGKPTESQDYVKKAEAGLRQIVAGTPDSPDAWVLLTQALVQNKRMTDAEAVAAEARKALEKSGTPERSKAAVAACLAMVGKQDAAAAILREMLKANPKDVIAMRSLAHLLIVSKDREEGKKILDDLLNSGLASKEDTDWATRSKALITAAENGYKGMQTGLAMLKENNSAESLRAQATLLASVRNRESRRKAAAILEDLVRNYDPPAPSDLHLLAQLHDFDNNWSRSRELYQRLLATQPRNPPWLALYIRALIKHHELSDAQALLDRLSQLAPQDPTSLELQARLQAEKGNRAAATETMLTMARRDPSRAFLAAGTLESLKIYDAAEQIYRNMAAATTPPESPLYLAAFLGRLGRTKEALDVVDRVWGRVKPSVTSNVSVQILYQSKVQDEECERAARKIQEALKATPTSSDLLFDLANIRSLQARYSEAEEIYRKLYEAVPGNAATLNNLAWLLAMQENPKAPEALEAVTKAVEMLGPQPEVLDTRAVANITLGNYPQAIKDLKDALAIRPEPGMYIHLAQAQLKANNKGEARAALSEAQANGFGIDTPLHPLEKKAYQELLKELGAE